MLHVMSQDDARRIVAAAHRVRAREGPGFPVTLLARPSGVSRATLYRRLAADGALAAEIERIRCDGATSPREQLLRAATDLLAEKGLSALTMDAVAERAGFSTATLYRHFEDREGVLREVVRSSLSAEPVRRTLADDGPLEDVLVRFVEAALARLREQPHLLRLVLLGDEADMREIRRLRRDEERLSTALLELLQRPYHRARLRAVRPQRLAAALMGQVLAALLLQRSQGEAPDATTIVTLFLRGALRPEREEGGRDDEPQERHPHALRAR